MEKQKGFTPILILVGILMLVGAAGGAYYLGRINNPAPVFQPAPQQTLKSTPAPSFTESTSSAETANWKTYIGKGVIFKYPQTWEIIAQVPENYKMFAGCELYIQNQQEMTSIMAIDILAKGSDGGYCWSYGYFYDYHTRQIATLQKTVEVGKWKLPTGEYPKDGDKDSTLWKGEWFQFYSLNGYINNVSIALIYKDKVDTKAESIFDQILSTFKFTADTDARIRVDLKQIQTALELYYIDYKYYPPALQELSPAYLTNMPHNPYDDSEYLYQSLKTDYELTGNLGDGSKYTVTAPK